MNPARHPLLTAALLAVVAAIGVATLTPITGADVQPLSNCLICGPRGVADAILNTALFLPLGLLLAGHWRPALALLGGIAFTGAIEFAQTHIPGRDPSWGDVLFNSLGTLLGVAAWHIRRYWLYPTGQLRTVLAVSAAAAAAVVMFLTGWLFRPMLPPPPYFIEWQPSRPHFSWYNGKVLDGGVGPLRLRPGPTPQALSAGELLGSGAPLGVWTEWGGPTAGLAPLIMVYDADGAEVAMVGVDREFVVFRQRTRATLYRLTNPAVRQDRNLDSLAVGDSLRIASVAARQPWGRCFDVGNRRHCGAGFTGAGGWALFYAPRSLDEDRQWMADAAWLALLALPAGYWASPGLALLFLIGLSWYGAIRLPIDTVARPLPPLALLGIATGLALGMLLAAAIRRRMARLTQASTPDPR